MSTRTERTTLALNQARAHLDAGIAAFNAFVVALQHRDVPEARVRVKAARLSPHKIAAELEREAEALAAHFRAVAQLQTVEMARASDWERRAMLAVQDGRDDLARHALVRCGQHQAQADQLAAELTEWNLVHDQYRVTIALLRQDAKQGEVHPP
ncbi:MAG: hypothetical protein ABJE47_17040 [bacterium]